MRKFLTYLKKTVLAALLLLLAVLFLLYLPPLQRLLKDKAAAYAADRYGLVLKVERFRLGFPLDLELEGGYAGFSETDTLISVGALRVEVGLGKILGGKFEVGDFTLRELKFRMSDEKTGMELGGVLGELRLNAKLLDLKNRRVEIDRVQLRDGEISWASSRETAADTLPSSPLDWSFLVDRIELQRVSCRMKTSDGSLLDAGVTEGGLFRGGIGLGGQTVEADSLGISGGWCHLRSSEAEAEDDAGVRQADSAVSLPWTLRVRTLALDNSAFSMMGERDTLAGIVLSGIGVRMDSVFNRGPVVRARLKELKAVQKDGVTVTDMRAGVDLDSSRTSLRGGYVRTLHSQLRLEVRAGTGVQRLMEEKPLSVRLSGYVGLQDVAPFCSAIPRSLIARSVEVRSVLSLTEKQLQVEQMFLDMPGYFRLNGEGSLSSYLDWKKMEGDFVLQGELPDIAFVGDYLKDRGVVIPKNMNVWARLKAGEGELDGDLRLCCGRGGLAFKGKYGVTDEAYGGELSAEHFPLDRFFPEDSVGQVSASVRFSGKKFSWPEAKAGLHADIRELQYLGHDYRDIDLTVSLDKTHLWGKMGSGDRDVPLDFFVRGDSVGREYAVTLEGRTGRVDLEALHIAGEPFAVSSVIGVQARLGEGGRYSVGLELDSLEMADGRREYRLGKLDLGLDSGPEKTTLEMRSGDMSLDFRADTSLSGFVGGIGKVSALVGHQLGERNVDMEAVRKVLPPFALRVRGARQNAVSHFLKSRDVGFGKLAVDVVSRRHRGVRFGIMAVAPYFGTVRFDSLQLGGWQRGKGLMYSLSAGASSEAWKGVAGIDVTGRIQGDCFRMELQQKNAGHEVGFDLGLNAVIGDSTLNISFFPTDLIFGYSHWKVNGNNRIAIGKKGRIRADLRMSYQDKLVDVRSLEDEGERHDRLQVKIAGIDLDSLSQLLPFFPDLEGVFNADMMLYSRKDEIGVCGDIRIFDLGMDRQRIGTVGLGMQYAGGENFTRHAVDLSLDIDSMRCAALRGYFSTSGQNRGMNMDMEIPALPLHAVNAFIPPDLLRLKGELTGEVRFRGTLDRPELNGGLAFRDGKADVVMLGTTFRLDTGRLPVENGEILFRKYRLTAPNDSRMDLEGKVTLTPFGRMGMNLSLDADNFELVNVKRNETSLIYGKAYADIHSRMSGAFSDLSVTGNLRLLNRTGITCVLRDSDPALVDKSENVVRFVSFQDTILNGRDDLTNRVEVGGFALRMLLEIGDQVKVGVDLSEDGNDHVDIQGGGNLVLGMNPESGLSLSGKYILTGGTVVYNIPIVGKKEFNIRNGSFVEWTGNAANPLLNISASASVKADVGEGEQVRQVLFETIIRIQNTLKHLEITFDLSAPDDMLIQNQLATFSSEERTRQALNLLIYNAYTAPGTAKSAGGGNVANNAIYNFVESELNKYTRKAGLTVGFDSRNTEENVTRTDVTYEFSRQLFNDRIRVKVGGRISADGNEKQGNSLQDNLVDDISIEYVLTKKRNLYVKVFRHSNYESVLDGEVIQTGGGIVWRKTFRKFRDLFRNGRRQAKKKQEKRTDGQD